MTLVLEASSANGQLDLLDKFATWVAGLSGWEMTLNQAPGDMGSSPLNRQVSFRRSGDGLYFHWQTDLVVSRKRSLGTLSTGAPVLGEAYSAHTGSATATDAGALAGISIPVTDMDVSGQPAATIRYWFHGDDDYIIVTANMAGGYYQHLFCGLVRGFETPDEDCYFMAGSGQTTASSSLGFDVADNAFGNPFGPSILSTGGPFGAAYHPGNAEFRSALGGGGTANEWDKVSHNFAPGSSIYTPPVSNAFVPIFGSLAATAVIPRAPVTLVYPSPLSLVSAARHYALGTIPGAYCCPVDYAAEEFTFSAGAENFIVFPAGKSRRVAKSGRYIGVAILTP